MPEAPEQVTFTPDELGRRLLVKYKASDRDRSDALLNRALEVYDIVMSYQREGGQLLALAPGGGEVNRVVID